MDEDAPIRAIVIGVSVLLAVATISAVLMYYNTAKQMASNVGRGQDFAENYEKSIQDILTTGTSNVSGNTYITGADVKNLLNYFYNDENVEIDIINYKYINKYDNYISSTIPVSSGRVYNNEENYKKIMKRIIDNQKFTLEKEDNATLENGNMGMKIKINSVG